MTYNSNMGIQFFHMLFYQKENKTVYTYKKAPMCLKYPCVSNTNYSPTLDAAFGTSHEWKIKN